MNQGSLAGPSAVLGASGLAIAVPEQSPFLRLPSEIRNMIYSMSLHWPDSQTLYSGYKEEITRYYMSKYAGMDVEFPVYSNRLRTPTILLLCRAITAECLGILKSRTLVIDRLPPWLPGTKRPMRISQFVGTATLQSLRFLQVHLDLGLGRLGSGWVWSEVVRELVDILLVRNAVEDLRVVMCFHESTADDRHLGAQERSYFHFMRSKILTLEERNPTFWAPGNIEIELWDIVDRVAYKVDGDQEDLVVGLQGQEARYYPDPYIWRDSLLEFL